ncbi:uncharacterized protein LOC118517399 [Anopheles stephensi]|uniref:uncharacterized protein LOC118517399 n=1 Tax=Anopheles stephensi TaxID=30069 RepID=UPI001658882E|nr:uncharacterized protein LOC118517399 [Anopheles stephensi]
MSKLRVYARYPKVRAEPSEQRSMEAYAGLKPMGIICETEHVAYSRSMLPDYHLAAGDLVLQMGIISFRHVKQVNRTRLSLFEDIRHARTMIIKKRYTGRICEVEIAHRLDGTPRPYVDLLISLRRFRKAKPAMPAHAE